MRQLLEVFPLTIYAMISIGIFLGLFILILIRTFVESDESIKRKSEIPLHDEQEGSSWT